MLHSRGDPRKRICLFIALLFLITAINVFTTPTNTTPIIAELHYGAGATRSMTTLDDGTILGGRSLGHKIEVWSSNNQGQTWARIGTVVNGPATEYGDVMFYAIPGTGKIFCAFREKNANNCFSVVVYRSDNNGIDWDYDSTVIADQKEFVGAPWLFFTDNGDLQCYYDSEPMAANNGNPGSQWIAMQSKNGITGDWNKHGLIAASKDSDPGKLVRDGMATVVNLGRNRIMVVTEGVEDDPSGGHYANVIRSIQSYDGGLTWDYEGRQIVYQSFIDDNSGRRYNAYCPMAIRAGGNSVGITFCTDEDFGGTPDFSHAAVTIRRSHIKYIQTTKNFQSWGSPSIIWDGGSSSYAPGMIKSAPDGILVTIDHFAGNQRFYKIYLGN